MPRTYIALLVAVLLYPAQAAAQSVHPRKQVTAISRGMTPAQVRQVLGEPAHVRREGGLVYMEYPNGCPGCQPDVVVVRDCRVVGARFENPGRQLVNTPVSDTSAPPEAECRLAVDGAAGAAPAGPQPVAAAEPGRPAAQLADTGAGAAAPAGGPPAEVPAATLPERPQQEGSPSDWRRRLTLRRPTTHLIAVPAASISSPTAFGLQMGEAFAGFAYQERTRYTQLSDGAFAVGIGLGDRQRYAGLEVAATSYSTIRGGGPLETGGLSFKLHRAFGNDWGVAVGWENAIDWGGSDAGNSPYGVVTHVMRLRDSTRPFSSVAATLGVGGGRFRSEDDVTDDKGTVNVFGALGFHVLEPVSLTADWNGQDLFAGVSVTPVRRVPLVINAGFADITGSAGDGARFIVSAGLGFRWLPPFF